MSQESIYEDIPLSDHDDKYTYRFHTHRSQEPGRVEILRYGESWIDRPQATKALISAANTIQELREEREELQAENARLTKELCKLRHPSSHTALKF